MDHTLAEQVVRLYVEGWKEGDRISTHSDIL
jgi:hypothetical protein